MSLQTLKDNLIHRLPQEDELDEQTLYGLFGRRYAEMLLRQNLELQARVQELDAFAHTVAHEIKGSLCSVIGFATALSDDQEHLTVEEQRVCITSLVRGAYKYLSAGGAASQAKPDYIVVSAAPGSPAATFSADVTSGRVPLTVTFTAITSGTIDTWLWNFGDGSTATTGPVVTHTFSTWGTFDASLVISNTFGSHVVYKHNYITVDPWRVFLPVVLKNH